MAISADSSDHQNPGAFLAPKRRNQSDDPADDKNPAQNNRNGDGRKQWQEDRQRSKKNKNNSLSEKKRPVLSNRIRYGSSDFRRALPMR